MKVLVVYYSRTQTTKFIAEMIADRLNADIEEIADLRRIKGKIIYFIGGAQATMKLMTPIGKTEKEPSGYDLVVLCTPVWASSITPAMRAYIQREGIKDLKTAHVCVGMGEVKEKTFLRFSKASGEPVARIGLSKKERESEVYREKLKLFFQRIEKGLSST